MGWYCATETRLGHANMVWGSIQDLESFKAPVKLIADDGDVVVAHVPVKVRNELAW